MSETRITIWWGPGDESSTRWGNQDELNIAGLRRANEMIAEGFTGGELAYDEDGYVVRGWWELRDLPEDEETIPHKDFGLIEQQRASMGLPAVELIEEVSDE